MNVRPSFVLTALVGTLFVATTLVADTWPGWRGATGDGVSTETDLPVQWSATENIRWQADLPGRSWA